MSSVCQASIREGYLCHDEMFVWAQDMLDRMPKATDGLRARFPYLFIDEVQDNSELQTQLLYRAFKAGDAPVGRQRLGDSNQAIFQFAGQSERGELDAFPIPEIREDMPDSFRFDQSIADLADPLAIRPQGMRGLRNRGVQRRHAVFLFDECAIESVIPCYARYLTETLSEMELREGTFTAVGAVHRRTGSERVAGTVGDYWTAYDPYIASMESQAKTFLQHAMAGRRRSGAVGESHAMVEGIAEGILLLARLCGAALPVRGRRRRHRWVLELLEDHNHARERYLDLIHSLCVESTALTRGSWSESWRGVVRYLGATIANREPTDEEVGPFLAWGSEGNVIESTGEHMRAENVLRYSFDGSAIAVRVGSVHSVKGETHTATLVLETFYHDYHLKSLKGWLTGERSGGDRVSDRMASRLRLHYVALSRPSQVLCLAMRADAMDEADIERAARWGWRIGRVTNAGAQWMTD